MMVSHRKLLIAGLMTVMVGSAHAGKFMAHFNGSATLDFATRINDFNTTVRPGNNPTEAQEFLTYMQADLHDLLASEDIKNYITDSPANRGNLEKALVDLLNKAKTQKPAEITALIGDVKTQIKTIVETEAAKRAAAPEKAQAAQVAQALVIQTPEQTRQVAIQREAAAVATALEQNKAKIEGQDAVVAAELAKKSFVVRALAHAGRPFARAFSHLRKPKDSDPAALAEHFFAIATAEAAVLKIASEDFNIDAFYASKDAQDILALKGKVNERELAAIFDKIAIISLDLNEEAISAIELKMEKALNRIAGLKELAAKFEAMNNLRASVKALTKDRRAVQYGVLHLYLKVSELKDDAKIIGDAQALVEAFVTEDRTEEAIYEMSESICEMFKKYKLSDAQVAKILGNTTLPTLVGFNLDANKAEIAMIECAIAGYKSSIARAAAIAYFKSVLA